MQVEEYLSIFDIEHDRVGIVFGPRYNAELPGVELEVNIRILEGDDQEGYAIDGRYPYQDVAWGEFMEETYPDLVAAFETAFTDAQLQYYTP